MNEEIKDIIEILELSKEEIENNNENITATLDLQDLKSLKNLYDLYNKEKEKNKSIEAQRLRDMCYKTDGNYISKDKIKEKIEEYNKMINATYGDMTHHGDVRRDNCIEIKNVLQELLEERN